MEPHTTYHKLGFLQGGGELGAITRAINWDDTSLGSPYTWPQSLRTTLGILLHSAFPMFLFWGPELICFYNDPYRPSLGQDGKHPCVGKPGKEVWPEIWDFIGPLADHILAGGDAVWYEDQLVPIFRNSKIEEVFWTFSYSPAYGDSGEIAGVLVTCMETTQSVQKRHRLEESEGRFRALIKDAPVGVSVLRGDNFVVESTNEAMQRFAGQGRSIKGRPLMETFPVTGKKKTQQLIEEVCNTGNPITLQAVPLGNDENGVHEERYYDVSFTPLKEGGKTTGILQLVQDTTDQVKARASIRQSEQRFRAAISAVQGILWTNDADGRMTGEQPAWAALTGQTFEQYQGYGWADAVHPDDVPGTIKAWEAAVNDRSTFVHQHRVRRRDGSWGLYAIRAVPLKDEAGQVYEWVGVHTDITEQRAAENAIRESEERFRSMIEQAPVAKCLFVGPEMVIEIANAAMIEYMGKGQGVIGKPLLQALPELEGQPVVSLLNEVYRTGQIYQATETPVTLLINGQPRESYYDYTFKPLKDASGAVWAIIDMSVDVTERVMAQRKVEEHQRQLLESFEQSPVGIATLSADEYLRFGMANAFYGKLVGRKSEELIGKPLLEALPELEGQGFDDLLRGVVETGKAFTANEVAADLDRGHGLETIYVDLAYQPLKDTKGNVSGILVVATDVTQQVQSRQAVEASGRLLRNIVESTPFPIGIYAGEELRIEFANKSIVDIFSKGPDVIGRYYPEVLPELDGTGIFEQLRSVLRTGKPIHMRNQRVDIVANGVLKENYFNYSFTPLYDNSGKIYAVMNTAADVTDVVKARKAVEDAENALRDAVNMAELGSWTLEPHSRVIRCTSLVTGWFGADGPDMALETVISCIVPEDRDRVIAAFQAALQPSGNGLFEQEYSIENAGKGQRHVLRTQSKTRFDDAGQPVLVTGLVQNVTAQRRHQEELERQVAERTLALAEANAQLTHSNEELAQYAYVASHDLQEPLRKIRVFSGMLAKQAELTDHSRNLVDKVDAASTRMTLLIKDLLEFSRLLNSESLVKPIDLNEVCRSVVSDFELSIKEKGATINIGTLPKVNGVGLQMNQLFYNLLSNALKFSRPEVSPVVEINSRPMMPAELRQFIAAPNPRWLYYDITIRDNGIGFESKYAEQIFEVFKRLHARDIYPGSGIGLALCRRIAGNAMGYLYADGKPGEGAVFHIILPDRLAEQG